MVNSFVNLDWNGTKIPLDTVRFFDKLYKHLYQNNTYNLSIPIKMKA